MNATESAVTAITTPSSSLLTDQSVAKQLLFGNVLEENLFPYPAISDRDREVLGMIVESVDRFLEGKQADFARWDRAARQPDEFVQSLRELGLFGLIIPEEFGGLGLSNAAYARVLARPRLLRNEDDLGYLLRALRNTFLNEKRSERRRLRPGPLPDQLDAVVSA